MGISGSVNDDLKWFYPDKTGFMFDTPPTNIANGRNSHYTSVKSDGRYYFGSYVEIPWNKDGGKYADELEHSVTKYNGWLNWIHKYEIDNRFLALSDKNANLKQFPEVHYPWKFTEYIFKGMGSGYEVVEPPLYDPATLTVVNGIQNPSGKNLLESGNEQYRKEGKLRGEGYEDVHYEPVYFYRCKFTSKATADDIKNDNPVLGPERPQYEPDPKKREQNGDLESGLIVDGKRYPPWTEPEAHFRYKNTFVNTQKICGARRVFKYVKPNRGAITYTDDSTDEQKVKYTGIRLYRKDILAKCVDRGQHGNIPPFTINMSAPKDYIEPASMTRNVVEAIVTWSTGQSMYAKDDGIVYFEGLGNHYNTNVTVYKTTATKKIVNSSGGHGPKWSYELFELSKGSGIAQPKPNNLGSKFNELCHGGKANDVNDGDLIHKGCPFFVGTETGGAYCKIKKDLLEGTTNPPGPPKNPIDNPEDFMGIFGDTITDKDKNGNNVTFNPGVGEMSYERCISYSASSNSGSTTGSACRYYAQQGPREILIFTCDNMTDEEFANSIGYNQAIETDNKIAQAVSGMGMAGGFFGSLYLAATPNKIENNTTTLNDMSMTKKVTYNFKTVDLDGRRVEGKTTSVLDLRDVVEGTGKFAFDKTSTTAIGGVDSELFSGTNLMSRNRFNSSIMQCYNANYCNKVYGTLNLSSGDSDGVFSGVGSDTNYCRYYNGGCPSTNVHQRAREYDREYKKLLNFILSIFRIKGISGFQGLTEVDCGGNVFAAVGFCTQLNSITSVPGSSGNIYFLYDISMGNSNHKNANVYAFIRQYGMPTQGSSLSEDSYFKMSKEKYPLMSNFPDCFGSGTTQIPWLVKLYDDYISPTRFESYVTNFKSFIGGRMPEYKDFSKMGEEIQCQVTSIDQGYDGDLTSGKGGDDRNKDYTETKSYKYYRVDASGEWVIEDMNETGDGISIGEDNSNAREHGQARVGLAPGHSHGATPILGSYQNSTFTQEKGMVAAKVTSGWCFSNDNRYSLANDKATVNSDDGEGEEIPNAQPPADCLPLERDWYYCPKCSPKPYSYIATGNNYNGLNAYGEPNINQIFTDFEYQQYVNCPRCGEPLANGGKMKHFAKCRAEGIVNYFGLPGELIDMSGFFWKNHTEISRSFISEILSKNGSIINGVYARGDSANATTESEVCRKFQYGENYVRGYLTEERRKLILNHDWGNSSYPSNSSSLSNTKYDLGADESVYTMTNTRASETLYIPSFMKNIKRIEGYDGNKDTPGLKYNDRYINPYALKGIDIGDENATGDGLDFISAGIIKSLRNMIMPMQGYPLYDNNVADTLDIKQKDFKDRFTDQEKNFKNRRRGIYSFLLASNQAGWDLNYVQFWDSSLIPGKTVKAYYPTSPIWWYRHDYVGGITRSGGTEGIHFNYAGAYGGSNEYGYGGNVTVMSFHSLMGWLPLDKKVERAIITFTPMEFPDCPPIGRTQKGGPIHKNHWHSFTGANFEKAMGQNHGDYDKQMLDSVMGWSDDVDSEGNSGGENLDDGNYIPTNYEGEQFVGGDKVLSQYVDTKFGFGMSQSWLSWGGYGEDLVQTVTEESIWKNYTFNEFKNLENKYTYDLNVKIGFETDEDFIEDHFTVIPKAIADGLLNNEGQAIPNMFNLSGLNSSGYYNRNGLEFAEKKINTDWAEGGQVIVQETFSPGDTTYNVTMSQSLGTPIEKDITKMVQRLYDTRIAREFYAYGGTAYSGIYNEILNNKVNLTGELDKHVNYRHYNSDIGGYWLNSMAFYPELVDGEFPTIESGMEYVIKPMDICKLDECGKIYLEMVSNEDKSNSKSGSDSGSTSDYNESNPLYYKYSPHVLCFCDSSGKPSSGVIKEGLKPGDGDWSKCIISSGNLSDMFFTLNISGYPTQTCHRQYRNEPGSWNVANAICTNPNCFVHNDGVTVAEASALSGAGKSQYKSRSFSQYRTKCGACGSDLTKAPGAMYTGGDGIETWEYRDVPKKNCIINGFIIDVDNTISKCGFDVYGKSSEDGYWEKLVSVKYDYDASKYIWKKYSGTSLIDESGTTLPVFKGIWKDGYNAAKEDLSGYHFLAKRCNKIKVVANPCRRRSNGNPLPNNGRVEEVTDLLDVKSSNIVKGSPTMFKTGLNNLSGCEGGIFEILAGVDEVLFSSEIRSYNSQTRILGIATELPANIMEMADNSEEPPEGGGGGGGKPPGGQEGPTYYYRIRLLRYKFIVKKFQVYGLELTDSVKITDDADTMTLVMQQGVVSMPFYDVATKILKATAIRTNVSLYNASDMGSSSPLTAEDLRYIVTYDSSTKKYDITGMEFFYDTYSNTIFVPYKCKLDGGEDVVDIDSIFNGDKVNQDTVPTAIEFKYMKNNGTSVDLRMESKGEGPSYALEADTITTIVDKGSLPSMGKSVFLRRQNKRVDMDWVVTNKERTIYYTSELELTGMELMSGVTTSTMQEFVGGNDEEMNGLEKDKDGNPVRRMFSGKVSGTATLTGLPNCIVSGILCIRAEAERTETINGVTVTEKTGGLKITGFPFQVPVSVAGADDSGAKLACIGVSKPEVVVYLSER